MAEKPHHHFLLIYATLFRLTVTYNGRSTMAAAVQGLLSLPTELLSHVCSFLYPEEVLSFALSSRPCASGAADILRGLQNIFLEYQIVDDKDPIDLLQKLRVILLDDFRARCVRKLEIGDVKSSWEDWTSGEDVPNDSPEETIEITSLSTLTLELHSSPTEDTQWQSYYTYEELEGYRRLLRAYIFRNFTANTLSNEHVRVSLGITTSETFPNYTQTFLGNYASAWARRRSQITSNCTMPTIGDSHFSRLPSFQAQSTATMSSSSLLFFLGARPRHSSGLQPGHQVVRTQLAERASMAARLPVFTQSLRMCSFT